MTICSILDYGLQKLKRGPDRSDEIDDCDFVLLPGTVKFLSHRLDVNRSTAKHIWNRSLASYRPFRK